MCKGPEERSTACEGCHWSCHPERERRPGGISRVVGRATVRHLFGLYLKSNVEPSEF